jgi:hypothetical protein
MKDINNYILEKLHINKDSKPAGKYPSENNYLLLNKSGIKGNKKYEKLARQGGYKYNGEYWFASMSHCSEEECLKQKKQHYPNNVDFVVISYDDLDEDSSTKK